MKDMAAARESLNGKKRLIRERHEQTWDESSAYYPPPFTGAQFLASFDAADFKFERNGCLSLTFTIPPEYIDHALEMRAASGIPLSIDVQVWKVYAEAIDG